MNPIVHKVLRTLLYKTHVKMALAFLMALSFCLAGYTQKQPAAEHEKQGAAFPSGDAFKNSSITYKLIPAANNTWCYDIYTDGRLMIHQPSAPGLPGNEGFKTKEGAGKVAELVISKMKKGEMPPSVTVEEMKKLKAIN